MKIFKWLTESNRLKHLIFGVLIFVSMTVVQMLCYEILVPQVLDIKRIYLIIPINALITTLIAMCSVEYIQKSIGGKWDWLDILAGILVPLILLLINICIL